MAAGGKSQREIAASLGINRRTVKRMLASEEPPRHRRVGEGSKVDPFEPVMRRVLESARDQGANMPEILREHGYEGSVDVVSAAFAGSSAQGAPGPAHGLSPGQVLEVDWAELSSRPRIAGRGRRRTRYRQRGRDDHQQRGHRHRYEEATMTPRV
jgi:hypothetical protein